MRFLKLPLAGLLLLAMTLFAGCKAGKDRKAPVALTWEMGANNVEPGYYENTFILKNISDELLGKGWTIYYSQLPRVIKQEGALSGAPVIAYLPQLSVCRSGPYFARFSLPLPASRGLSVQKKRSTSVLHRVVYGLYRIFCGLSSLRLCAHNLPGCSLWPGSGLGLPGWGRPAFHRSGRWRRSGA